MKVGIVGCGLIGGSIGLALRSASHKAFGYDANADNQRVALERGCIDEALSLEEIAKLELVFLAVPPKFVVSESQKLLALKGPETILSDCTSVKSAVVDWLDSVKERRYVPGHPMAGHEKSGPKFASGWMFRGARWILTPCSFTDKSALKVVEGLVKELGAVPARIEAKQHDREVALLSHLPHVLAAILAKQAADLSSTEASGGSWKDLTRVAGVDPDLWTQILCSNSKEVAIALEGVQTKLEPLIEALKGGDESRVKQFFVEAVAAKKVHA